jgi:hypothetical protein
LHLRTRDKPQREPAADEITRWIDRTSRQPDSIQTAQQADPGELIAAFRNLSLAMYWELLLPLFHFRPQAPARLLTVRPGHAQMLFGDIFCPMEQTYYYFSTCCT